MAGRIIYLVFGTLLIVLTVGDAWFTDNDARGQQANLIGVLGGIGLMVAASAFRAGRQQQSMPAAPPFQYPQMTNPQVPPGAQGYPGQPNPGQARY